MNAQLTKRERVMRAVRFQETDRVPVYDILENDLENAIAMFETVWEG